MNKDDLEFFCGKLGYNWIEQVKQALELAGEELQRVVWTFSGYDIKTKQNLIVFGRTLSGTFKATFYLSQDWQNPTDSIYSLQELRIT